MSDIKTALLEENGKISFLPYSNKRPANPSDLNIQTEDESVTTNLILDGKIMDESLSKLGYNKTWLERQLQKQGVTKTKNIFLATYDANGNLCVYLTNSKT